jgi:PGF-pre-PGF domain-containing protein
MSTIARPRKLNARDVVLSMLALALILAASLAAANSDINCSVIIPQPDTRPPLLIVTQPVDGQTFGVDVITVSGTATDPSGILSVTLNGNKTLSLAPDGSFSTSLNLATGANLITLEARDNSLNAITVTLTVTYTPPSVSDTQPPTLLVDQPLEDQIFAASAITMSGSATDASGIFSVTVNGNDVEVEPDGSFSTSLALAEGANTITTVATDNSPNRNTATVTRTVTYTPPLVPDTTPPTLIVASPLDREEVAVNSVAVSGSASDESGIFTVSVNGAPVSLAPDGSFSSAITLAEGANTIIIVATDNSPSRNTATVTRTVTYTPSLVPDNLSAELIITQPANNSLFQNDEITVSGFATDASGIYTVYVNGYAVSVAAAGSFSNTVVLAEGENTITITAADNSPSMNTATVTRTVMYTPPPVPDTTPPNLIITHPLDGQTFASNEITVTGFVTDESGIYAVTVNGGPVTIALDDSFSRRIPLKLGSNTITVTAIDASELRNTATVTITVTYTPPVVTDTTAPALTIYQPVQGTVFAYNEILVSGTTADESGIRSVTINGDAVALAPDGSFNTPYILTEGANTLTIVATDNSPNRNTKTVVRTVTYSPPPVPDTTPPILVVNEPPQNAVFNRHEVMMSGTVSDEGGRVTVTVNGDAIAVALDGSFSAPVILTAGANAITVRAADSSGNIATIVRSVTYSPPPVPDTTPPTLQVTQPLNGQMFAFNVTTVMGTATDASDIRSLTVNGVEALMIEDRFSAEVRLLEGANTITVRAIDLSTAMNRQEVVLTVTYSPPVDNDPPTLSLTQPEEGLQIIALSNRTEVAGTVTDPSGIYSLSVNAAPVTVTDTRFSASVQLVEGLNLVTVIATDNSPARNQRTVTRNVTYALALVPPGPPHNISLTANPPALEADGEDAADISARVIDENGTAVADGTEVDFSTTNGFLYPSRATVNGSGSAALTAMTQNGTATVLLVAPLSPGTATVTATAGAANGTLDVPFSASASTISEDLDTTVLITHSPTKVVHNCSLLVSGGILKLYTATAIAVGIVDDTIIGLDLGSGTTLDFTVRNPIIKGGLALCELEHITLNNTDVKAQFASRDAVGSEVDVNLVTTCRLGGKHFLLTQHRSLGDALTVAGGADAGLASEAALNAQLARTIEMEFGKSNYHTALVITATLDGAADEEILTVPIKITVSDRWFAASANRSTEHIRLIETNLTTGLVEEVLPVTYWVRVPDQTITFFFEADDFSTFALIAQPPAAAVSRPGSQGGGPPSQIVSLPVANAGTTIIDFEALGLDIRSISVTLSEMMVNLQMTLTQIAKPSNTPDPIGAVYAYFELVSNIPPENLAASTVNFRVSEAWIQANSLDTDAIKLLRYLGDGSWQALATRKVGEDDQNYYYAAETLGLSIFAIIGEKETTELTSPAPYSSPSIPGASPPSSPLSSPGPRNLLAKIPWVGWVAVVLVLIFAILIGSVIRSNKK